MELLFEQYYNLERGTYIFPLEMLEELPTLKSGHFDNLKIDTGSMRVWLSRCGKADGLPYDNQVTIEHYKAERGRWVETATYEGV